MTSTSEYHQLENWDEFFTDFFSHINKDINIINKKCFAKKKFDNYSDLYLELPRNEVIKLEHKYIIDINNFKTAEWPDSTTWWNNPILKHMIAALEKIYHKGYEFPKWVNNTSLYKNDFTKTKVYYHKEDDFADVKRMAKEREPVNIAMSRLYIVDNMQNLFGWKQGAYGNYDKTKKLMPNIAIYCHARIYKKEYKTESRGIESDENFKKIHVINLVGIAFDNETQPDYKHYIQNTTFDKIHKNPQFIQNVQDAYKKMWKLCMTCAIDLKNNGLIDGLHIYNVGSGAFYNRLQNDFIKDIFNPIYKESLIDPCASHNIKLTGYTTTEKFNQPDNHVPAIFFGLHKDTSERTLYVNAWDPWSIIGNGNSADGSLDGFFGRHSNMSVLGWSMTNPFMTFVECN